MADQGGAVIPATKACHNCRRGRKRCDRSFPHCNKCTRAGKECLGYGNLFRWTGSVASRGKLAGLTAPVAPSPISPTLDQAKNDPVTRLKEEIQSPSVEYEYEYSSPLVENGQLVSKAQPSPVDFEPSSPWVLVDPLYQDMGSRHRFYLHYFTSRLCQDLVSYDLPERNPFRSLLPLTKAHPLLQHVIVASSAIHMSNQLQLPPVASMTGETTLVCSSGGEMSRRALRDALASKQKALQLMHDALQDVDAVGIDIVLAAALFFVNVELIESGKHGWRAHLEGAWRIMSLLPEAATSNESLRDYMLSDCFTYFILGSAFLSATEISSSYFQPSQIQFILKRATANSYLCCPPEILEMIYAASQLSNMSAEDESIADQIAAKGAHLLQKAQAFDLEAWAYDIRNTPYLRDIPVESRIHAGSAHRLTACLYILQAIPCVGTIVGDGVADTLSRGIFEHLSSIPDEDPNFKATAWPTFIAGAEATDPARRTWVMYRLQRLVACCPWGFLFTAMETLPVIWGLADKDGAGKSWVQTLKDPDLNFLIV